MEKRNYNRSGQSLVEYIVVLALVAIIAVSVIHGVGQRSQSNLQAANDGLEESRVATSTAGSGNGKGNGTASRPGSAGKSPEVKVDTDPD
jgi:type II secretory pathway pseudopilin PulG